MTIMVIIGCVVLAAWSVRYCVRSWREIATKEAAMEREGFRRVTQQVRSSYGMGSYATTKWVKEDN